VVLTLLKNKDKWFKGVSGLDKKKTYEKPKLKKIRLDARCAVLGFCKAAGSIGQRGSNCGLPLPCNGVGS
jgi:hypothetical protein